MNHNKTPVINSRTLSAHMRPVVASLMRSIQRGRVILIEVLLSFNLRETTTSQIRHWAACFIFSVQP